MPDRNEFEAYLYEDTEPLLTNMLIAIAAYRWKYGNQWPSAVHVREGSTFVLDFGDDIQTRRRNWGMFDSFYFQLWDPIIGPLDVEREPVIFDDVRVPPQAIKFPLRTRVRLYKFVGDEVLLVGNDTTEDIVAKIVNK